MAWEDSLSGTTAQAAVRSHLRYPRTEEEWRIRYDWLRNAYSMEHYSQADANAWALFRSYDDNGRVQAETRRLGRDRVFVVDRNAETLFGDGLTLEALAAGTPALVAAGDALLARSNWAQEQGGVAHRLCALGRLGGEVVRSNAKPPYQSKIVWYEPDTYMVFLDPMTGRDIERVEIKMAIFDSDDLDANGNIIGRTELPDGGIASDAILHTYRRVLTRTRVDIYIDEEHQEAHSGEHGLEVVPFVNLVYRSVREPEHGHDAAHGLDSAIALIDSLVTQIQAIGNRHAHPTPVAKGFKLGGTGTGASDAGKFGRWINGVPADGDAYYMEFSGSSIGEIRQMISDCAENVRQTFPEFAVFGGGSNLSGEALRLKMAAFASKVHRARLAILPGIARLVQMGLAMDAGEAMGEVPLFRFLAPPVLPADLVSEAGVVAEMVRSQILTRADAVRHMQRLGLVARDANPETYAVQAQDESTDRAREFLR